jgi:hypothetical protein
MPRPSLLACLSATYCCRCFYRDPVVNFQEKSESGLSARSFTPVAPPFIFAVYVIFASNFEEGVSVTEVGALLLSVALTGLVLLPEKSWTL